MKCSDSFLLRDEDQTCSTADDLMRSEFEEPPKNNKDGP